MQIDHRDDGLTSQEAEQVWRLLRIADREFVPPLSARDSSTQTDFTGDGDSGGAVEGDGPVTYFHEVCRQKFLLARDESGEIAGFLSYRLDAAPWRESGDEDAPATAYVTTVIVDPEHRRRGITTALYTELFALADAMGRSVSTRTWSLNDGHLRILERFGFAVARRLPDDRGPGVDTVYLERPCGSTEETGARR